MGEGAFGIDVGSWQLCVGESILNRGRTLMTGYNPPRFWWTKRIAIGSVGLVLLVVGLVAGATAAARERLDSLVETYRAAGEPVYAKDFDFSEQIPDDVNGATYYVKAENAFVWPAFKNSRLDINKLNQAIANGAYDDYAAQIDRLISTNGAAIDLVKQGAQCSEVDWGYTVASPILGGIWPNLGVARKLATLLSIAAHRSHIERRDRDAIETLLLLQKMSRDRATGHAFIQVHLATTSWAAQACNAIEHVSHDLQIVNESNVTKSNHADRSQVQSLVNDLLDESRSSQSIELAIAGERAAFLGTIDFINKRGAGGILRVVSKPMIWLYRPSLLNNGRIGVEHLSAFKSAASMATYPQTVARLPAALETETSPFSGSMIYFMPYLDTSIELEFRSRALRRMAATALAIRLFESDRGHRPKTLAELVPEYLDAVPRDPFAEGDVAIRYLPRDESPILYSIGSDGVDDGGDFSVRVHRSPIEHDFIDVVFFLDGDRPGRTK